MVVWNIATFFLGHPVCVSVHPCVWHIIQKNIENEFQQHSKESRGVLGEAGKQAGGGENQIYGLISSLISEMSWIDLEWTWSWELSGSLTGLWVLV